MKLANIIVVIAFAFSIATAQENYLVRSISFIGNTSFSGGELRDVMLMKQSPAAFFRFTYKILHVGGPPVYFNPFVLKSDSQRIQQFYRDNGFFDANVGTSLKFDHPDESVDIYVTIKEGIPALVRSLTYHGIPDSSKDFVEQLKAKTLILKGMRYSAKQVNGEDVRIIGLLQNDGYAYARWDSSVVTLDSNNASAAIGLYFSTGKKYYWGPLSVKSSDSEDASFNKAIVIREMLFKGGDVFSISKKSQSEERIDALNLYEPARITIPDSPPLIDTLSGALSLKLRPGHEVTLGPLINDDNNTFNLGGSLVYLQRNVFGDARLLTLSTNFQLESLPTSKALSDTVTVGRIDASAQLTQPYFFSNTTSLTWGVSFLVDKQKPYSQLVLTNKIQVSKRIAEFTTGYLEWDLERAKLDSLQAIAVPVGLENTQLNSILSLTLLRDKTNDIASPTEGFYNLMTLEEGGILPNLINNVFKHADFPYARYWKFVLLGKWFFPLDENQTNIFALKTKVGYAQEYGTYEQDLVGPIPLNYRFYAGGSGSNRGWRTRELGEVSEFGIVQDPEYGGNTLLETNFEDRFKIIGDFGGVAFIDAGNLWNSYKDATLNTIAVAIGFGMRYNTFFGPLRFDFGNRLYDPTEPEGHRFIFQQFASKQGRETLYRQIVFEFGIGQAF
ncbi:MAG: outer membrane protein assembly factor [Candidatus Kryptoniota bacterium]